MKGATADLTGKEFGRLRVISLLAERRNKKKERFWLCSCSCGSFAHVATRQLVDGRTRSCGCYKSEMMSFAAKKRNRTTTGMGLIDEEYDS